MGDYSMRVLKFFLILTFLPLLANEDKEKCPPSTEKKQVEHTAEQKAPPPNEIQKTVEHGENKLEHQADTHKATESYETAFIKTIVVLVGLLVLVILTVWMFKRISNGRIRTFNYLKSVKILEKRPLSPKSMLYLIEVSGKQVLIAESQLEVRTVATLDWLGSDKDL
jgi:flagellar protein FliO/FliZ